MQQSHGLLAIAKLLVSYCDTAQLSAAVVIPIRTDQFTLSHTITENENSLIHIDYGNCFFNFVRLLVKGRHYAVYTLYVHPGYYCVNQVESHRRSHGVQEVQVHPPPTTIIPSNFVQSVGLRSYVITCIMHKKYTTLCVKKGPPLNSL